MAAVWVTTDRRVVEGCEPLGEIGIVDDNDLDQVRRNAANRGADIVRIRSLRDDQISASMFRCSDWDPRNLPTPTPSPTEQQILRRTEMARMKARVRTTRDPEFVLGCEKRGESVVDPRDGGEDLLRGLAVGGRSNVLLLQPVRDPRLFGVLYRCGPKELERIDASTTARPPPTRTPAAAR
ncbi:MAG: hypothetical protein ABI914_07860 [Acidobacteriota bacterium]